MHNKLSSILFGLSFACILMVSPAVLADSASVSGVMASCTMTYKMSGFSLAYKQYDGIGNISCSNGQRGQVKLASKSIGFTIGKSEIVGTGVFSDARGINEIYGTYIALEGHAGATESVDGQVLTKGEISLVLSGKGRGVDIGVTLGALTISPN